MADKTVTVGSGRDYASLQAAITGEVAANANLVTMEGILHIVLYPGADTTAATVAGFTTSASYYVNIYTHSSARHAGVWDDDLYTLSYEGNVLAINNSYTRVTGLQISLGAAGNYFSQRLAVDIAGSEVTGCHVTRCLVRSTIPTDWQGTLHGIGAAYNVGSGNHIYNNIVYGFLSTTTSAGYGIVSSVNGTDIYSNTVVGCRFGVGVDNYRNCRVINNLISDCLTCFDQGADSNWNGSGYNATDNASWGNNYEAFTGDRLDQTFTFLDAVNHDYRLSGSDTGAKGYGTDLSEDANCPFSVDVTGTARPATWDIGADQSPSSASYNENLEEAHSASEATGAVQVAIAGVGETDNVAESVAANSGAQYSEDLSESGSIGEGLGSQQAGTSSVNETDSLAENIAGGKVESVGVSESTAAAEEISDTLSQGILINYLSVSAFASLTAPQIAAAAALVLNLRRASVGGNILGGLNTIQYFDEDYDRSNWTFYDRSNPGWATKLTEFATYVGDYASSNDVLSMKFCFVDYAADVDDYIETMETLEAANPTKKFVWWTMPTHMTDNIAAIAAFNGTVRTYCAEHGKILYDIASIESHEVNGDPVTNGGVECLSDNYNSYDGGHLNELGSERAAQAFWVLMSEVAALLSDGSDLNDDVATDETTGVEVQASNGVNESVGAEEEAGAGVAATSGLGETDSVGESAGTGLEATTTLAEGATAGEAIAVGSPTDVNLEETVSSDEGAANSAGGSVAIGETASASDSVGTTLVGGESLGETATVTEGLRRMVSVITITSQAPSARILYTTAD